MNHFNGNNMFDAVRRCSQIGSLCSCDGDCLQSCPFGEIHGSRMACSGTDYERSRGLGKCQAAWAEPGDSCVIGSAPAVNGCSPGRYAINNMYCQQAQLGWPNFAPGFNQNKVGQGYCAKRTMADPYQVPVLCTRKFVDQMRSQNLLGCDCPTSALHRAHELCNNVQTAYCGTDGQIIISLM